MNHQRSSASIEAENKYLCNLANMFNTNIVKSVKSDTRLKDLEPLPYIVWNNGELVKLEDTLPTTRSTRPRQG